METKIVKVTVAALSLDGVKKAVTEAITEALKNCVIGAGKWVLHICIEGSYVICLTVAIGSVFCYIGGVKKAGKGVTISTIVFFILQAIKPFIK